MRRTQRIVLLAAFVLAAPVLSGCANFDPESLDIFGLTEKKKLPGDRKPVFPEGVPGVVQGVPPQYIKGNQPPADAALVTPEPAAPPPAAAPVEEPKPKPTPALWPEQRFLFLLRPSWETPMWKVSEFTDL